MLVHSWSSKLGTLTRLIVASAASILVLLKVSPLSAVPANAEPQIYHDEKTGEDFLDLRILTYNIEGLPWPVKSDRRDAIKVISQNIAALRNTPQWPDVILIQEGIVKEAAEIGLVADYPDVVTGPNPGETREPIAHAMRDSFGSEARWWKGENVGTLAGSGLWVFSQYSITKTARMPFGPNACAGYDCLANKGIVYARIDIPGVPESLHIFTTHMNSRRSSGVPYERANVAHHRQADRLAAFIDESTAAKGPVIIGGDFNVKGQPERFLYLARQLKDFGLDRADCAQSLGMCDDHVGLIGTSPWLKTEDLQWFHDGDGLRILVLKVEELFDKPVNGQRLSDHNASLVTYRLSWPAQLPVDAYHITALEAEVVN